MLSYLSRIKQERNRNMSFKAYRKVSYIEARPYVQGEDMKNITISALDIPEEGGWIARNPNNHVDQWYLSSSYFNESYEEI